MAHAVPLVVTVVVAERVVAGPAVGGAGLAVVELIAHHVIRVAELALIAKVHVLGPVLPDGQPAARRQPADQVVLVLWTGHDGDGQTKKLRSVWCVRACVCCRRRLPVKQRYCRSTGLPVDPTPEDSAFQASIIRENVPCNHQEMIDYRQKQ